MPQAAPRRADPPSSPAAERALIGSALLDYDRLTAEGLHGLQSADFFSPIHSIVWLGIERVAASQGPVGVITVTAALAEMGELDRLDALLRPDTPEGYMVGCWADSWAVSGSSHWAKMIREYAERRRAIARGSAIVRDAHRGVVDEEPAIYDRDEYKGLDF